MYRILEAVIEENVLKEKHLASAILHCTEARKRPPEHVQNQTEEGATVWRRDNIGFNEEKVTTITIYHTRWNS